LKIDGMIICISSFPLITNQPPFTDFPPNNYILVWERGELPINPGPKEAAAGSQESGGTINLYIVLGWYRKTPVSNESWINMMLSHCLVGLVSYCSNASGTKWYVDDSPHLVKNIFEHLFNYEPLLLLFSFCIFFLSKTSNFFHSFCDLTSFPKVGSKNIFFENRQDGWKRSKFH